MKKSRRKGKTIGAREINDTKSTKLKEGRKTYALVTNDDDDEKGTKQRKVCIPPYLEKELLKVVQERRQTLQGGVSLRFTAKKLQDMYTSLQMAGFDHAHIEQGLRNTVPYGGDVIEALDWLCLNIPNEELPAGFSSTFREEQDKRERGQFTEKQLDLTTGSATNGGCLSIKEGKKTSETSAPSELTNGNNLKSWILNYADNDSDESDDVHSDRDLKHGADDIDDVNEMYIELSTKLSEVKRTAVAAKNDGKKDVQKQLSQEVHAIINEMRDLEKHGSFDPSTKTKCQTSMTRCSVTPSEDTRATGGRRDENEEMGLGMLEEAGTTPPPAGESSPKVEAEPRSFRYTRQQWTGKSPKQFLLDWCSKHLGRARKPTFVSVDLPRNCYKCRLTVYRPKDVDLVVTPDLACRNVKEAEHLASTQALYVLCKGQSVHQLLPPPYGEVWREWMDADREASIQRQTATNKPRDQLIARLMDGLSHHGAGGSAVTSGSGASSTDAVLDDWERLADEDVDSRNKKSHAAHHSSTNVEDLKTLLNERKMSLRYKELLSSRRRLPVFDYADEIASLLSSHRVLVVSGETGCGKSTQIPQFVLEGCIESGVDCNIVVTEPRRISATSLARRVCEELDEGHPGSRDSLCGYQIRFETRRSDVTRLMYCTTGVLLRRLQDDPNLTDVTHVIVDEVHERSMQSDFLLIILKQLLSTRDDLHVILMSATLDSELFAEYFLHCPVVNMPGRSFNVEVKYLEDVIEATGYRLEEDSPCCLPPSRLVQEERTELAVSTKGGHQQRLNLSWTKDDISSIDLTDLDPTVYCLATRNVVSRLKPDKVNLELIVELLKHMDSDRTLASTDGAVLIFLPGLAHIQQLYDNLMSEKLFSDKSRYKILALHSVLSSEDQSEAFVTPARGIRKVVLATNIAETGITIPDVVFVIDTGKAKELRYIESSQMSSLDEVFISQASAKQRQGRAGRVTHGTCYRLYTRAKFESLPEYTVPEIRRVPLEELCLHVLKCSIASPEEFLSRAIEPPSPISVATAMRLLREIGACYRDADRLTPLGRHLSVLPVHVRLGKMLIFAAMLGCLPQIAVVAAAMTVKSPFSTSLEKRQEATVAKQTLSIADSDHLTLYRAFIGWLELKKKGTREQFNYCRKHCLKQTTLVDIDNVRNDLIKLVESIGFTCPSTSTPRLTPDVIALLKAALVAGMYPNVATVSSSAGLPVADKACAMATAHGDAIAHQTSVNHRLNTDGWVIFHEKVKQNHVYVCDSTVVSAFPLLLFGGQVSVQHTRNLVTIDDWLAVKASAKTGVLFREIKTLLDRLLNDKLERPAINISDDKLVVLLKKLLQSEST